MQIIALLGSSMDAKKIYHSPNQPVPIASLSEEPGFVSMDLTGQVPVRIPAQIGGLLGFIYFDGRDEIVIKILMLDDLAKGFQDNRPFSGRANRIAYLAYPPIADFAQRVAALETRLKLYGELTRKYQNRPNAS